jgi:hypothetical protein
LRLGLEQIDRVALVVDEPELVVDRDTRLQGIGGVLLHDRRIDLDLEFYWNLARRIDLLLTEHRLRRIGQRYVHEAYSEHGVRRQRDALATGIIRLPRTSGAIPNSTSSASFSSIGHPPVARR